MFKRFSLIIGGVLLLVNFTACSLFAQNTLAIGELIVNASGLDSTYTISITGTAASEKTRWDYINSLALPTSRYGSIYHYCKGNQSCGFDAPDSKDSYFPDMAWAYYNFEFECTDGFSRTFSIDFRDRDWKSGYWDLHIRYFRSEGKLKYLDQYDVWHEINEKGKFKIWEIFHDPAPNKSGLLVPVTATNNFSGGKIKMDGTTYSTPKTLNWGWTTPHTIAAVSPQYVDGKKYTFQKWSDGNTQLSRSLTIDDHHNSYTFTANFSTLTATMSGPSYLDPYEVGTFTANPSGGVSPYDYTWYRMELGGGPEPLRGGVQPCVDSSFTV